MAGVNLGGAGGNSIIQLHHLCRWLRHHITGAGSTRPCQLLIEFRTVDEL
jgi:hypothetical protein